jgi:hypothetical protein
MRGALSSALARLAPFRSSAAPHPNHRGRT